MAALEQSFVDELGVGSILFGVRAAVLVEADAEIRKVAGVTLVDPCDELLGADALLLRAELDGGAVGVICADVKHIAPGRALGANEDVGLDVLYEMAQVQRTRGVGQSTGDEQLRGHRCLSKAEL